MRADKDKLFLAMARECMNTEDLTLAAQIPRPTVNNVITGRNVRPATIGRIAKALNIDPADIIEKEKGE